MIGITVFTVICAAVENMSPENGIINIMIYATSILHFLFMLCMRIFVYNGLRNHVQ